MIPRVLPVAFGRAPFVAGQAFGAFGSVDKNGEGGLSLEGATRGLGFRGSFTGRHSDDIQTPNGKLFNSGNQALTSTGSAGVRGARGSIDLSYTHRDERVEIHEDPAEDPTATPYQRITDDLGRVSAIVPVARSRARSEYWSRTEPRRSSESDESPPSRWESVGGLAEWLIFLIRSSEPGGVVGFVQDESLPEVREESLIPARRKRLRRVRVRGDEPARGVWLRRRKNIGLGRRG